MKKFFGSGKKILTISNKEVNDMEIIKSLRESGLLIKGVSETIKNEAKEQKEGVFGMLLGTLGASVLGNPLTCKEPGESTIRGGEYF